MSGWGQTGALIALGAAAFCFLAEAAFAVALIAVSALSRVALHRVAQDGEGRQADWIGLREPRSTWRLATVLAQRLSLMGGVALTALAASFAGWSHAGLVGVAVGTLFGVLLLETLVGQLVALRDPRVALRGTVWLVRPARAVLLPIVQPLHLLLAHRKSGQTADDERDEEQEEEAEALIEVGEREGILEADEGQMMRGIVDLDETLVREIMTPRTDIAALPATSTVAEARQAILTAGHSRMPVYRETIDDVVGVLHERDLLRALEDHNDQQPVTRYLRGAMFVPELLSAAQLLSEMRVKTHMALVVDEYGGVAGLVTLEDLLEEIVGDIRDEHDDEETLLRQEPDGAWIIDAAAHVEELEELFGFAIEDRDFDTIGGLVVSQMGRMPNEGETLAVGDLQIEIVKADRRRIRQVRVRRRGEAPSGLQASR